MRVNFDHDHCPWSGSKTGLDYPGEGCIFCQGGTGPDGFLPHAMELALGTELENEALLLRDTIKMGVAFEVQLVALHDW